jgi:23S rRNA (cytosine1962-C5)-methyltransferase
LLRGLPVEPLIISLNGLSLAVNIENGQKTGLFLDQVLNQKAAAAYAKDRKVLDCFCYQGGFALACAKAGASQVIAVDESKQALELADQNSERNGLQDCIEWYQADAFKVLRDQVQRHDKFDLIILDPPSFARSKADLPNARKALKEINSLAMKLLSKGGVLLTCTCSHHVSSEDFLALLSSASGNTGRSFRILEWRTQSPDHPILLSMPETHYLKCVILEVA